MGDDAEYEYYPENKTGSRENTISTLLKSKHNAGWEGTLFSS